MICVVDASVAVKWFAEGDWALHENDIEPAIKILQASTRIAPDRAQQNMNDLAALDITWATPTVAYARAIDLACQLNHHLFDTLYHAVALSVPGAVLVTADRRYFAKAQHLGQIVWLPDFSPLSY